MQASSSSHSSTGNDGVAPTVVALAVRDKVLEAALAARLEGCPELAVLRGATADAAQRGVWLDALRADVLLLDEQWLETRGGPAALTHGQARRVLVVTERGCAALAEQIVRHGLKGFLVAADAAELCSKAVRAVTRGETWLPRRLLLELLAKHVNAADAAPPLELEADTRLTRRESEVVRHVRRGFANKQIADSLAIREDTVKKHLRNAYTKLGVHRRSELMTSGAERPRGA